MRFSRVLPLVAGTALLAACGDDDTGPSNTPPTAAFTAKCNPLTSCTFSNSSTDADGTIEGYDWDFGDHGPHGTTRDADHAYAKPGGEFTVSLAVTDDDGATATATAYLVVSRPYVAPTARFTFSCTELTCDFTNQSFDISGTIEGYEWDFGDDSAHATTRDASHSYAEPGGQFTVSLTVTDNDGATVTSTEQVDLAANVAPTASFTFSCTDLTCTFADGSTDADGTIEGYDWDFGDGQTSTEQSPEHSYAVAGDYVVALTITDSRDSTGNASRSVRVPPPPPHVGPTAAFTASCSGLECVFTNQSTPDGSTGEALWEWQFGDGARSHDESPSHVYQVTEPTTFTVTLLVCDQDLACDVVSHEVTVEPPE